MCKYMYQTWYMVLLLIESFAIIILKMLNDCEFLLTLARTTLSLNAPPSILKE